MLTGVALMLLGFFSLSCVRKCFTAVPPPPPLLPLFRLPCVSAADEAFRAASHLICTLNLSDTGIQKIFAPATWSIWEEMWSEYPAPILLLHFSQFSTNVPKVDCIFIFFSFVSFQAKITFDIFFFLLHCSYSDVSHTLHFFNPVMVQRSKNQTVSWGMVDTSVPWTVGDVYLLLKDSKFTVCSAAWAVNKHFTPLWGPLAAIFAVGFPSYLTGAANDLQSHGWTFMSPPFFLLALA